MAAESHAFLSPSAAHRWMNCPAAPGLESRIPDQGSVFAAEGSLAHAICEAKLRAELAGLDTADIIKAENKDKFKQTAAEYWYHCESGHAWTEHELYDPEMEEHTDYYHDVVWRKLEEAKQTTPDAQLLIETKLDFRTWIPDGFGTADAIIIADGTMDVIDFKYGKGVQVEAEENPQMMIYALGAFEKFSDEYNIQTVRMTIVQPRLNHVSTWDIEAHELEAWGEKVLIPAAKLAYKKPDQQSAGSWCKFCKIKTRCRKFADWMQEGTAKMQEDPRLLTNAEIAELLPRLATIKSWCTDLEAYALEQALAGEHFPGFKLVEGRSVRTILYEEEVIGKMQMLGVKEEDLYKPRQLKGIGELEKMVGKTKFAQTMGSAIVKPQGKPTLVPESDKRKEWSSAASDFEGINID